MGGSVMTKSKIAQRREVGRYIALGPRWGGQTQKAKDFFQKTLGLKIPQVRISPRDPNLNQFCQFYVNPREQSVYL